MINKTSLLLSIAITSALGILAGKGIAWLRMDAV